MKKFKHIVPFLLAVIMALAIPLAGCDSCGEENRELALQSISINTSNAKTVFTVGDEFTSDGLEVKASMQDVNTGDCEEITLNAGDYTVDSGAYKKDVKGTYPVKVSYTYKSVTKDAEYEVEVTSEFDGLEVTLAEGTTDTYTLSATQTTAEIDISKIVVKDVNRDGSIGNVTTGYTTKLYKGQEEISLTNGKATVGGGAYAIWVEKASDIVSDYTRSAFVLVYVNDDMVKFEWKSGNLTQSLGEDVISGTWKFTATYASGATKEISGADCEFDINTMTVAKDIPVTITYTDVNAKGEKTTKTCDKKYTVTMVYGKTIYKYDYNAIDNSEMGGDQTVLKQSDLKGVNSFLKLGDGTITYRNKTKWNAGADVVEIKNVGFKVTFFGVGKITVGYSSTGGSNWSRVGLMDAAGNYIPATYETSASIREDDTDSNSYQVYGTSPSELTFTITKAGTYSIVSVPTSAYNRGCRIHSIIMEDNVDDPANIVCDVDFTDTAKFNTADLAGSGATAPVEINDAVGAATGLSVTKSSNPFTANRVTDVNGIRALQLQGTVKVNQNSLVFNAAAGKIKITVKYFHSAGKYIDILNVSGAVLASSSANPASGTEITEYTVTLDVAADTTLYLGSHDGALNISYLKVEKV